MGLEVGRTGSFGLNALLLIRITLSISLTQFLFRFQFANILRRCRISSFLLLESSLEIIDFLFDIHNFI